MTAIVIVGAGPAGLAAAIVTAEAGLQPTVIDENPLPGGQVYRQAPASLRANGPKEKSGLSARGAALLGRFQDLQARMVVLTGTPVWGLFPPRRLALGGGRGFIEPEHLILATGACEYVPPFPGWTLPGVMTPGGGQLLVKTMGVLPGRQALVAGTGPFLLVVADQLQRAGVRVAAVVEATRTSEMAWALPGLLAHRGLCWEGVRYLWRLRRAGVPILRGHLVTEARGEAEVSEVVVAPCDDRGYPDHSRGRSFAVDTLCVGYGFVPRTQLAQLAGCRLAYVERLGGWLPEVDGHGQTSVPGVWVAGDGGGIGGALMAELGGTLAGLAVARQLGAIDQAAFDRRQKPVARELARLGRFRAALNRLTPLRPGFDTLAATGTVVCRCEEITRAEVETGIAAGGTDLRTLKVMTRLGMGPCQGMMCWPAVARFVAARTGRPSAAAGPLSVRHPVGLVSVGDLAGPDA